MRLLDEWADRLDNLGPVAKRVGDRAEHHAARVYEKLCQINDGIGNLYPSADSFEYPRLAIAAGETKTVEGRQGYLKVIRNIAVVAPAATNVDIFTLSADDSGFVHRLALGAAGSDSKQVEIPVPDGQPIFVRASAAAQVNLIVRRIKP